jgi:hypothetical protein
MSDTFRPEEGKAMTEAEWLAYSDPKPMLVFLHDEASDRCPAARHGAS